MLEVHDRGITIISRCKRFIMCGFDVDDEVLIYSDIA